MIADDSNRLCVALGLLSDPFYCRQRELIVSLDMSLYSISDTRERWLFDQVIKSLKASASSFGVTTVRDREGAVSKCQHREHIVIPFKCVVRAVRTLLR